MAAVEGDSKEDAAETDDENTGAAGNDNDAVETVGVTDNAAAGEDDDETGTVEIDDDGNGGNDAAEEDDDDAAAVGRTAEADADGIEFTAAEAAERMTSDDAKGFNAGKSGAKSSL